MDTTGLKPYFYNDPKIRSCMMFTKDSLVLMTTDTNMTCKALAQECINRGAIGAINLDGGGSTCIFKNVNGKLVKVSKTSYSRANANWILVYLKEVPKPMNVTIIPSNVQVKGVPNVNEIKGHIVKQEGRSYIAVRDLEKLGFKIDFIDGQPIISKK